MARPYFSHSSISTDLVFEKGQLYTVRKPIRPNQIVGRTAGGQIKVAKLGKSELTLILNFTGLTKDNYDGTVNGLKTWFETAAIDWRKNSFTLVDETGTSYTVRLMNPEFDMQEYSPGRYRITLTLRKEI